MALAAWPEDLSAYTVILVTSSDEAGARKVAWDAARSGLEAGLLRSDDYTELGEGFWLVFAGRFKTAAAAERRAAALGERYEGAYPQQVVPKAVRAPSSARAPRAARSRHGLDGVGARARRPPPASPSSPPRPSASASRS